MNAGDPEVLKVIEEVAHSLSKVFKFGYYSEEDIQQEAAVFAIQGLNHYDPSRGTTLKTFLTTHVKNRLINLKRDKFSRPIPKDIDTDRLVEWEQRNALKRSLAEPLDISDNRSQAESSVNDSPVDSLAKQEAIRLINKYLPAELRSDYRRMLDDMKIPKHRRTKIYNIIKEILAEHYGEIETWAAE